MYHTQLYLTILMCQQILKKRVQKIFWLSFCEEVYIVEKALSIFYLQQQAFCNDVITGPYSHGVTRDLDPWPSLIKHHFRYNLPGRYHCQISFHVPILTTSSSSDKFVIIHTPHPERLKNRSPTYVLCGGATDLEWKPRERRLQIQW